MENKQVYTVKRLSKGDAFYSVREKIINTKVTLDPSGWWTHGFYSGYIYFVDEPPKNYPPCVYVFKAQLKKVKPESEPSRSTMKADEL